MQFTLSTAAAASTAMFSQKERFARKTLKPKELRNHPNVRFNRNVHGQTHFMTFYSTAIPRASTDKAGSQFLILYVPTDIHGHHGQSLLVNLHHFQLPRATSHGHPQSSIVGRRIPRTTTDIHGQRHFVKILKLFASQATEGSTEGPSQDRASGPKAESTQDPEALSTQQSRACAVSSRSRLPSWDCVGPATASLGLAVWDAALGTGGGKGKIPSLILRLTLPAWSVR